MSPACPLAHPECVFEGGPAQCELKLYLSLVRKQRSQWLGWAGKLTLTVYTISHHATGAHSKCNLIIILRSNGCVTEAAKQLADPPNQKG